MRGSASFGRRRSARRLVLEINVSKLLTVAVAHDEAGVQFLDRPRRRESGACFGSGRSRGVFERRIIQVAQEKLIETSGIPYTIIRSTQFLEFLGGIAASSADGNIVRISPGLFQPIAADDVAAIVADVPLAAPRNGIVEIAGPERARI